MSKNLFFLSHYHAVLLTILHLYCLTEINFFRLIMVTLTHLTQKNLCLLFTNSNVSLFSTKIFIFMALEHTFSHRWNVLCFPSHPFKLYYFSKTRLKLHIPYVLSNIATYFLWAFGLQNIITNLFTGSQFLGKPGLTCPMYTLREEWWDNTWGIPSGMMEELRDFFWQ